MPPAERSVALDRTAPGMRFIFVWDSTSSLALVLSASAHPGSPASERVISGFCRLRRRQAWEPVVLGSNFVHDRPGRITERLRSSKRSVSDGVIRWAIRPSACPDELPFVVFVGLGT